jgi:hypothetical protein
MALTDRPVLRSDAMPDEKLGSIAILMLCGCAYVGVALAFSYLDRRLGRFGVEAVWWIAWTCIGFGNGMFDLKGDGARGRGIAKVLTGIAGVLTLFPGFLMFRLDRWAALMLLLFTAARAADMRTRRDFYYALAAIVAVSLLAATHSNADWTTWFYLGPAWLAIAMALAWDYAAGVQLGSWRKSGLTLGFVAVCIVMSTVIFTVLPQPRILGFGFLPPGSGAPGRVQTDAGATTAAAGSAGERQAGSNGPDTVLGQAVQRMRRSLKDPMMPAWQRSAVQGLLAGAEALMRGTGNADGPMLLRQMTAEEAQAFAERVAALQSFLKFVAWLLALALAACIGWLLRWRIGIALALWAAWALVRIHPAASMRCSSYAIRWMLARTGHPLQPGQSVLEHVETAVALPAPVRGWLERSTRIYCADRFGGERASELSAAYVRRAVEAARELMRNPVFHLEKA